MFTSGSPTHSRFRSASRPEQDRSCESSASSAYSCSITKESHPGSDRGSKDEAGSTTGNMLEHKGDGASTGKGSGSKDLESKCKGSNHEGSGSEWGVSCSKNEESGSGSGSGSGASESEEETPKAKPDKPPPEAPSEVDHHALQTPLLPRLNDKDSKDMRSNHCDCMLPRCKFQPVDD